MSHLSHYTQALYLTGQDTKRAGAVPLPLSQGKCPTLIFHSFTHSKGRSARHAVKLVVSNHVQSQLRQRRANVVTASLPSPEHLGGRHGALLHVRQGSPGLTAPSMGLVGNDSYISL